MATKDDALIDRLRGIADFIPVSHIPAFSEVAKIGGALIAYVEHGETLFQMAEHGAGALTQLIAGADDPVAAAEAVKTAGLPQTAEQVRISQLTAELQSAKASLAAVTGGSTGPAVAAPSGEPDQSAEIAALRAQLAAQAAAGTDPLSSPDPDTTG